MNLNLHLLIHFLIIISVTQANKNETNDIINQNIHSLSYNISASNYLDEQDRRNIDELLEAFKNLINNQKNKKNTGNKNFNKIFRS
jgi:hypothetical protein